MFSKGTKQKVLSKKKDFFSNENGNDGVGLLVKCKHRDFG